jgi:hypothetical protein
VSIDSLASLITGGIGAIAVLGIFLSLIVAGKLLTRDAHNEIIQGLRDTIADKDRQIEVLAQAVQRERERGDAGVLAAQITRDVMQGIRKAAAP